jgi:hypothetical protein
MERNKRRMLTRLAATGVLAGALAGGGTVLATAAPPAALVATATSRPAATGTVSTASTTTARKGAVSFLRRHHGARLVFNTAAAYLGLTQAQLHAQLHAGSSLAAVATARGKPVSGLESAIIAAITKRVDDSKLTAARKAQVISNVQGNVDAFVTATHPFEKANHRLGKAAPASPASSASPAT